MSYEELKEEVMKFFGDTSRPASETREALAALMDEIQMLIDTLPEGE